MFLSNGTSTHKNSSRSSKLVIGQQQQCTFGRKKPTAALTKTAKDQIVRSYTIPEPTEMRTK